MVLMKIDVNLHNPFITFQGTQTSNLVVFIFCLPAVLISIALTLSLIARGIRLRSTMLAKCELVDFSSKLTNNIDRTKGCRRVKNITRFSNLVKLKKCHPNIQFTISNNTVILILDKVTKYIVLATLKHYYSGKLVTIKMLSIWQNKASKCVVYDKNNNYLLFR